MSFCELKNVCKGYGEGKSRNSVLQDINLTVEDGEFVAILGFSGSGKTTLINSIAGLIEPDSGEIFFKGKKVTEPSPERGIVFQNYSLMPWLTVFGNIYLAVNQTFSSWNYQKKRQHVQHYIDMVGLSHAIDRRPAELSGGMRQRVSVARALSMQPNMLLLDEPLSALDALTRAKLQDEINDISQKEKKTILLITNDVDEALLLADRVIPLNPGPRASLGPDFRVNIPRPRDRTKMNNDDNFKSLRKEITEYLMKVGMEAAGEEDNLTLPSVLPNTSFSRTVKSKRSLTKTFFSPKHTTENAAGNELLAPLEERPVNKRYVEFSKLTKIYPTPKGPLTVVEDFDLKMKKGEFISLIGHSGCGKSTVLSMAAGLNNISEGSIILDGKEITDAGPDRGVVFQAPSLFPWLSARDNVRLGVEQVYPHATIEERKQIVEYNLSRVGLADAMDKRAAELSNGMKQRVGIARAFALSPKLLLLDEPFGMLDSLTRWELQEVLMDVWKRTEVTAMCVTHDVDEAILLADRVVMMTNGPNAKVGKILEVNLPRPRTRKALLAHPDYYRLREEVLTFLSDCDHPSPKNIAKHTTPMSLDSLADEPTDTSRYSKIEVKHKKSA